MTGSSEVSILLDAIAHLKVQIDQLRQERHLSSFNPIDSGDTAWILVATILVFSMTIPGIMLYYSGMVKLSNSLSTAMQGYALMGLITFLWLCFGYSLAFGPANHRELNAVMIGDTSRFWLHGILKDGQVHQIAPTIPESLFCLYQFSFAVITPTLICGAFADRMKFSMVLASLGLWHLFVYCPIAHWNWHPDGFLHKAGVLDFAGGNVVHVAAGASSYVASIIIGKRQGFGEKDFHQQAHNLLLTLVGESPLPCSPCLHTQ
jgi:ammonium transporter, Amt family